MTAKPAIANILLATNMAGCIATGMLFAQPASAAIFRSVDANGTVTFSDQPPASERGVVAERIEINAPNTFVDNSPRLPYEPTAGEGEENEGYADLKITSPGNDELIRDNAGNVVVRTRLTPDLKAGHTLRLELNGTLAGARAESGALHLTNLPRGTHQLRLVIENDKGRRLFESDQTVFHLQRFSALLNPGRNQAQPKRRPQPQPRPRPRG